MEDLKMAVIGIGATGSVLAAALLNGYPDTVLIGSNPDLGKGLMEHGITVSGAIDFRAPINNFSTRIADLKDFNPGIIFLCTKTFHLEKVLNALKEVYTPGQKIVSTQNGLGTEALVAEHFGKQTAFRMSLNYGVSLQGKGTVQTAFFNRPNHLGCMTEDNRELGSQMAQVITDCGLDTEFVEDIQFFVWKKMVMKCTMASICAITDKTIKEALEFPPTRRIADACFKEALSVAKAMGYDLGEDYLKQALGYLEKVGVHKDSMCFDIANKAPTEIDFLGAKIVDYAADKGIPTPYFETTTNLVKAIEDNYL